MRADQGGCKAFSMGSGTFDRRRNDDGVRHVLTRVDAAAIIYATSDALRKIKGQSGWTCLTPRRVVVGPERGAVGCVRRRRLDRRGWPGPCNHGPSTMINKYPEYHAVNQSADQAPHAPDAATARIDRMFAFNANCERVTRAGGDIFASQTNSSPGRRATLDKRHDSAARMGTDPFGTLFCAPHPKQYCNAGSSHAIGNKQFTSDGGE